MKVWIAVLALLVCCSASGALTAAPVDPAAEAGNQSEENENAADPGDNATPRTGTHSWDAPAIKVEGKQPTLKEEELIGSNEQPRWTSARRWNRTRTYVIPEGEVEIEYWHRMTVPRRSNHGSEAVDNRFLLEVEFGLPLRFQLDMYLQLGKEGSEGAFEFQAGKFEVRWAPFKWGFIYTNPTLYLEYTMENGEPDAVEGKILLGDKIIDGLHWGFNFVFEHVLGGDHDNIYALTAGISYTLIDSFFSIGLETENEFVDTAEDRGDFVNEHLLGPSIQIKPLPQMHVNIVAYVGIGGHSPAFRTWVVIGWEF
ncbi:MAG: hypothetical protein H6839_03595 [Planctomycetes bacterium]|nr:hypothetical protein [Planctomycetota bacterium]